MSKASASEMSPRRILLIDDSPIALKALKTVLGLHPSWEIVGEAENGPNGLALFHEKNPNVVIVDFQMPGMNGIEVGREIRRSGSGVLLILFSLHTGAEVERLAADAGFDAVLSKSSPFPIVGIIERIRVDTTPSDRRGEAIVEALGKGVGVRSR